MCKFNKKIAFQGNHKVAQMRFGVSFYFFLYHFRYATNIQWQSTQEWPYIFNGLKLSLQYKTVTCIILMGCLLQKNCYSALHPTLFLVQTNEIRYMKEFGNSNFRNSTKNVALIYNVCVCRQKWRDSSAMLLKWQLILVYSIRQLKTLKT